MKKINFLLVGIILIAAILRLWGLGSTPPSPDWDEVALGYDAYSIIQTGRDEYGQFLPVVLRSFDDYKPALYAYLTIPAVALFGLNIIAVRLPSAIFGILAVLATYFLVKELFLKDPKQIKNSKNENSKHSLEIKNLKLETPIVAAALLAISPWHIQFSRIAFESNVGDALNIFAALFFLKGLKKPWMLSLGTLSAALALYVYQSEKVFTPLFMLLLVAIFYKQLIQVNKKKILIAFFVGVVASVPMVYSMVTDPAVLLRAKGTSIFQDKTDLLKDQVKVVEYETSQGNKLGMVLDNRRVVYVKSVLDGYLSHFNPNWLLKGDIARHHAPDMGLIYLWEFPFILIGIYTLLFYPFNKKIKLFIFGWFLLAPLPASVTTGVPHAVRTLNFLPTWQIFTALGLISAFMVLYKSSMLKVMKLFFIGCFMLFISFNFIYYLNQYFVQQNYFHASEWQYGYEEVVPVVKQLEENYKKVVISDSSPMDKSYMFFLFYLKYPPEAYQEIGRNSSGGFAEHHAFAKYEFRTINWNIESNSSKTLYVGRPEDFPPAANVLKVISYPDGKPAMLVVEK